MRQQGIRRHPEESVRRARVGGTGRRLASLLLGLAIVPAGAGRVGLRGAEPAPPEGFLSIFDGRTLTGWTSVPAAAASDWTVRDGAIAGTGSADRQVYLCWQERLLADFELRLRYRLLTEGNTGIEIRARPDTTGRRPFVGYHADLGHVGIGSHILGAWDFHFARRKEYPCPLGTRLVIDPQGEAHATRIEGGLTEADIRPRDWNDVHIIARGRHFQFFINGKLASEFTDNAAQGALDRGVLGLQLHERDMRVEFKDLWLKIIEPTSGKDLP